LGCYCSWHTFQSSSVCVLCGVAMSVLTFLGIGLELLLYLQIPAIAMPCYCHCFVCRLPCITKRCSRVVTKDYVCFHGVDYVLPFCSASMLHYVCIYDQLIGHYTWFLVHVTRSPKADILYINHNTHPPPIEITSSGSDHESHAEEIPLSG
jgi:hypothetical protein